MPRVAVSMVYEISPVEVGRFGVISSDWLCVEPWGQLGGQPAEGLSNVRVNSSWIPAGVVIHAEEDHLIRFQPMHTDGWNGVDVGIVGPSVFEGDRIFDCARHSTRAILLRKPAVTLTWLVCGRRRSRVQFHQYLLDEDTCSRRKKLRGGPNSAEREHSPTRP
jgi:hypothetical protein